MPAAEKVRSFAVVRRDQPVTCRILDVLERRRVRARLDRHANGGRRLEPRQGRGEGARDTPSECRLSLRRDSNSGRAPDVEPHQRASSDVAGSPKESETASGFTAAVSRRIALARLARRCGVMWPSFNYGPIPCGG